MHKAKVYVLTQVRQAKSMSNTKCSGIHSTAVIPAGFRGTLLQCCSLDFIRNVQIRGCYPDTGVYKTSLSRNCFQTTSYQGHRRMTHHLISFKKTENDGGHSAAQESSNVSNQRHIVKMFFKRKHYLHFSFHRCHLVFQSVLLLF